MKKRLTGDAKESKEIERQIQGAKKSQPTSSQVHVPVPIGGKKKLKKEVDDRASDDSRMVGKVVIFRDGKMMLGRRADNDAYDFPGGRIKDGEDIQVGTLREVQEETGLELDPKGLIALGFDTRQKSELVEVYAFAADLDACPPLSETGEGDGEMSSIEWIDVSQGVPEDVLANMHQALEDNIVLQCMQKSDDTEEAPNALSDLQDAQEMVSGIDWEVEQQNVDPLTAREMAWSNLENDPLYYRKQRLVADSTSDELQKDTEEGEEDPFDGEGFDTGFWLDLGSHNCRESGHIGLDLYPYDYGTAVHDLDTGLPFPDGSVSKVRMSNVLDDENLSDPKALLSEIHRVMSPGGEFLYEGETDIQSDPTWEQDYPGFVMVNHEDGIQKSDKSIVRQKFTRIATPDPATADDAEPRVNVNQYNILPSDALLAVDASGYEWSDATSSGRGNRMMGYPSQGALLNKSECSASSATESNHLLEEKPMFLNKSVPILKKSMQQVVYCVVLEPDSVDSQDDIMTAQDIESSAHNYLINARVIGSGHEKPIDAHVVESFLAPQDLQYEGQNGPQIVKLGSWVIGIKVNDPEEWQKVVNGEYAGVSVGGEGRREDL